MADLKDQLIEGAITKDVCDKGLSRMKASTVDALIDYYLEMPDWCLERDFPSLDFLRENFTGIEDKGVFVDKTFKGELLIDKQVYVFHNCKGTIKVGLNVDKALIPMLYIANGCKLKIQGVGELIPRKKDNRAMVPIYSFGKNDVSAKDNNWVKFIHYRHNLL